MNLSWLRCSLLVLGVAALGASACTVRQLSDEELEDCGVPKSSFDVQHANSPGTPIEVTITNTSDQVVFLNDGGCGGPILEVPGVQTGDWPTCRPSCDDLFEDPGRACAPCQASTQCIPTDGWVAPLAPGARVTTAVLGLVYNRHELGDFPCLEAQCEDGEGQGLWDVCVTVDSLPAGEYSVTLKAWAAMECCSYDGECEAAQSDGRCGAPFSIPTGQGEATVLADMIEYPTETKAGLVAE